MVILGNTGTVTMDWRTVMDGTDSFSDQMPKLPARSYEEQFWNIPKNKKIVLVIVKARSI